MKTVEIIPVFVEKYLPEKAEMKPNHIYISEFYHGSSHLCLCGCGQYTFLPLNYDDDVYSRTDEWNLIKENNGTISFTPSIGNFKGENPYHAHYIITKNKANFC